MMASAGAVLSGIMWLQQLHDHRWVAPVPYGPRPRSNAQPNRPSIDYATALECGCLRWSSQAGRLARPTAVRGESTNRQVGGAEVPRTKVRVRELATLAGKPADEVIERLRAVGVGVVSEDDYVPKSKASLARRVLGIDPSQSTNSVAHLAAVARMSEQELRKKLAEAGIHLKRSARKLRKDVLWRAEVALGLRTPKIDVDEAPSNSGVSPDRVKSSEPL